jgi:hypothetical protein
VRKLIVAASGVGLVCSLAVLAQPQASRAEAAPTATAATTATTVRAASFNVQSVSLDATIGNQRPWKTRRAGVIADILGEKVDVVGVQEANVSRVFASRLVDGVNQLEDLKNGLNKAGGAYQVTNRYPYNCVNYWTTYKCVYVNRNASGGDRILYNTRTLSLVSQGTTRFTVTPSTDPRYIAWRSCARRRPAGLPLRQHPPQQSGDDTARPVEAADLAGQPAQGIAPSGRRR